MYDDKFKRWNLDKLWDVQQSVFHSLSQRSAAVSLCVISDITDDDLNQRVEVAYILVIYLY